MSEEDLELLLWDALMMNDSAKALRLIDEGTNPWASLPEKRGAFPMLLAAQKDMTTVVERSLSIWNPRSKKGHERLSWDQMRKIELETVLAAAGQGSDASLLLLIESGASIVPLNSSDPFQYPFEEATRNHRTSSALILLENGCANGHERITMESAARNGDMECLRWLIVNVPEVRTADMLGSSLIEAAKNGKSEAVGFLLREGADPRSKDKSFWTADMWATAHGYRDLGSTLSGLCRAKEEVAEFTREAQKGLNRGARKKI